MVYASDTLGYQHTRPLLQKRDMSWVKCSEVAECINDFMKNDKNSSCAPEEDAITFYLMNHAFSLLQFKFDQDEPMKEHRELADLYFAQTSEAAIRAFYYLILICTRESRHVYKNDGFHDKFKAKYGSAIHDFNLSCTSKGSTGAQEYFRTNPPSASIGQFTEGLVYTFNTGSFGGGFGGLAWGKVAECLNEFVWGRYSAEMMLDTVWTLCHNNGPIFNKGMLYKGYTGDLVTILDVQRSGQIPQMVADHIKGVKYINTISNRHVELHQQVCKFFKSEFSGLLDWFTVEKLGALHSYNSEKVKQQQVYGESPEFKQAKEMALLKAAAKEKAEKDAKINEQKNFFFISPGQKIAKVTREKAKLLAQ